MDNKIIDNKNISTITDIYEYIGIENYSKEHANGIDFLWSKVRYFSPYVYIDDELFIDKQYVIDNYKGLTFNEVLIKVQHNRENRILASRENNSSKANEIKKKG